MTEAVKSRYHGSRRQARTWAARLKVIEAAKLLFIEHDYPATTIEAIAEAAETPMPTLYRLFGSKRTLLAAVLDASFGGDDQPIAFGDRPAVPRRTGRNRPGQDGDRVRPAGALAWAQCSLSRGVGRRGREIRGSFSSRVMGSGGSWMTSACQLSGAGNR